MFLLHINTNKFKQSKLFRIYYLKNLIKKIKTQLFLLQKIRRFKLAKNLRFILSQDINSKLLNFKSQTMIKYIIGISNYKSNTILYLTDVKGTVKFFCTSGSLGITRKQTKKKVAVVLKLLKILVLNNKFLSKTENIALHFKNFNKKLVSVISSFLITSYPNIKIIKINNNQPHNGCRPKKIKRKKRKKLFFNKM